MNILVPFGGFFEGFILVYFGGFLEDYIFAC
jgi:hypothetical protein